MKQQKWLLSLCLALALVALCLIALPTQAQAASSGKCGENLTWTLDNKGTLTISGTGAIEGWVFSNNSSIKSVVIKNGVTSIAGWAFCECTNLKSITIPKSVTHIGGDAFYSCVSLENVYITDLAAWCNISAESYGASPMTYAKNLYLNGKKLTGKLTIPSSVTSIAYYAFSGCEGLTAVSIPSSVTSIGNYAFSDCIRLTSVTVPKGVKTIGTAAFSGCIRLTTATLSSGLTSIGTSAFAGCTKLTAMTIPNGVTTISGSAFYACSSLKSVTIPKSVTHIGGDAFSSCESLENVYITDLAAWCNISAGAYGSAMSRGRTLYLNGKELTGDLVIPRSVTSIANSAFSGCNGLTSVIIPDNVKTIGVNAFRGCDNLAFVSIGNGVTTVNEYAFSDCNNLSCVSLPANLDTVEAGAFSRTNHVLFRGNQNQKNWIVFKDRNQGITEATWHLNAKGNEVKYGTVPYKYQDGTTKNVPVAYCTLCKKLTHGSDSFEKLPTAILKQPVSTKAANGKTATVTVSAIGEGLTYKWYFAEKGQTSFKLTTSYTGSTYSVQMNDARNGRRVYCQITDKTGKTLKTNTVTLSKATAPKITKQPVSVKVLAGKTATVSLTATGEDLTYTWYFKNAGASSFSKTTAFTGTTYSATMDATRNGRQLYCVVKDKYGQTVKTNTVTISLMSELKITKQPTSVSVIKGKTATVSLSASGTGLRYTWYFKNPGASSFSKTTAFTGNTYKVSMDAARSGRQLYCVVTDKYGQTVKTNTVTISMAPQITKQPVSVKVAKGKTATVSLSATGDGLTYTWYFKNAGASSFSKTTAFTGNTYSATMDATRNGRQLYCVVKDKYGQTVKTNTVTISMAPAVKITTKALSVRASTKTVSISLTATGEGLKYTWYLMDPGSSSYSKSSVTSRTYSYTMTAAKDGRKVYCVVTDKYGQSAKTAVFTIYN